MRTGSVDEPFLFNYLLGKLSEEEQVQVEDRAFADAEYLGALEAAEADLIDSYIRGELSAADRRQFERRFLTSPQRRSKVEFARSLAQAAAEFKPSRPLVAARVSVWQAFLNLVRASHPALQLAAGMAALIVVAGVAWLGVQNASMRSRVAALEAHRTELESRKQALQQQLWQQQASVPETQRVPMETQRPTLIASLVLLPGLSRAESSVPQLTLARGAQLARIEIHLEARDEHQRFRAELHTRGEEVLARSALVARRTASGYSVSFDIPASALPVGEYELALKGGQTTDIGYYYFHVQRQ